MDYALGMKGMVSWKVGHFGMDEQYVKVWMEGTLAWKVGQHGMQNGYAQLDEKIYKEDIVSCCFPFYSVHIQVFFVHWIIRCHDLGACLQ